MAAPISRRVDALGRALAALVSTTLSLVLAIVLIVALPLVGVWVGIPVTVQGAMLTRRLAGRRRREVGLRLGREIDSPYLHVSGHLLARFSGIVRDPAFRRDLRWLVVDGSAGLALAIVAVVETLLDLMLWWLPMAMAERLHDRIDAALLSVSEKSRLALRVQELTESRSETVDINAAELRRIERDLHDGAQARIVSLGMSLALAEELLTRDPDAARALLSEARTSSSDALGELRDLVRGIHPPVLADRGLPGAVQALALAAPLPVTVTDTMSGRLPAPLESAVYFAVAELLTNVVKHAEAGRATIRLDHRDDVLTVQVTDDGRGGADESRGTGLRGLTRRIAAFDGRLQLTSPPGGPTEIVMVLPCALSSPKISPSSGTV